MHPRLLLRDRTMSTADASRILFACEHNAGRSQTADG